MPPSRGLHLPAAPSLKVVLLTVFGLFIAVCFWRIQTKVIAEAALAIKACQDAAAVIQGGA